MNILRTKAEKQYVGTYNLHLVLPKHNKKLTQYLEGIIKKDGDVECIEVRRYDSLCEYAFYMETAYGTYSIAHPFSSFEDY